METTIKLNNPVVIPEVTFDKVVFPLIEVRTVNGKTHGTIIMDFATTDGSGKTVPLNKPQRIHLEDLFEAAQTDPLLASIASLLVTFLKQSSGLSLVHDATDDFAAAVVALAADILSQEADSDI